MDLQPSDAADTLDLRPGAAMRGLRPWPWSLLLLRGAIGVLVLRWLAGRLLPAGAQAEASAAAWGLFGLLVVLRWFAGLPDGAARARAARAAGRAWLVALGILLVPAELIGLAVLAAVTADGCLAWLTRRPLPARPPGRRLEDRRKGFYDGMFAMNVISMIVEIPLMVLILSSIKAPGLHVAMHALEAVMIVGLLGDRWLVLAGGHVLEEAHLDLRAGARAAARLPLAAIAAIEPLGKERPQDWCRAHGVHRADTGRVSVLDRPNLVLTLHPGTTGRWTRLQVERPLPRHLFLYLDDPGALAPAVAAAVAQASPSR